MLTVIRYRQSSATVATVSSFPTLGWNLALIPHLGKLLRSSPPSPPHSALRQPQCPCHRSSTAKPRSRLSLATRHDDVSFSQVYQNYHQDPEATATINHQINLELYTSHLHLSISLLL